MIGNITGFILWLLIGCAFIGLGLYARSSKKTMGFWANAKVFAVTNVKKYNNAVAKLFIIFGIVFIILGLPLLLQTVTILIFVPMIGVMIESIVAMIVYTVVIEKKYRKK